LLTALIAQNVNVVIRHAIESIPQKASRLSRTLTALASVDG